MIFDSSLPKRNFLVPEVVQTSAMDCGPATLKCLLEGFGISVSYGRLREACQTDVDGTSLDTIEDVAVQLGLEAEQIMMPADHLLLPESQALPSIVVVCLPNGLPHFVVVWRTHGRFVQIMDPGTGRRWLTQKQFLRELYIHTQLIPVELWNDWVRTDEFCAPLRRRLSTLKLEESVIERLIETALESPCWQASAALDAATRMLDVLVRAGGLEPGEEVEGVLERFFSQARNASPGENGLIPPAYWSVRPLPEDEEQLLLRGAILVRVTGRQITEEGVEAPEAEAPPPLSPELVAALEEPASKPEREFFRLIRADGLLTFTILITALILATIGVTIEALLLKGLLDIGQHFELVGQRIGAIQALFAFFFALFLLELPISTTATRIGRRLETRLRIAFLEKIPRLSDRYFHSRLTSDMTQRAYELRQLRTLPNLAISFFRLSFQIVLTAAGVIWLNPVSAPLAILATLVNVGMAFVTQPLLREQDLRLRTHIGALSRFYLDALLGLIPIRTHRAEQAVRHEYENLLVDWVHAGMALYRTDLFILGVEYLIGAAFAVWILFNYVAQRGETSGILLLLYWVLRLPDLGKALADTAQQYPMQRNRVLRLFEPLNAPEESEMWGKDLDDEPSPAESQQPETSPAEQIPGMSIVLQDVSVQAGGHTILTDINLTIQAGEHIAIMGPSGAGKSSLVGLLLGWHRPAAGTVQVDGMPLKGRRLHAIRKETAWVDPSIRLWNRSLHDNLRYGSQTSTPPLIEMVLQQADLLEILAKLPAGAQTPLGEGGGLVSGGEGQRVRLGRAMLRSGVRLVILDEPFRGLDREKRRELLRRTRQYWQKATLIFISHDVGEALTFERVVVVENGRIVEDDAPETLMKRPNSRYRAMAESEEAVRRRLWESADWRRLWLEEGWLSEKP